MSEEKPPEQQLPPNSPIEHSTYPSSGAKVPSILGEAFKEAGIDISDPKFSRVVELTVMSISGSSPLPPAILLEQWESLYPGITAKFVEWIEKQAAHRQFIEKTRAERSEDRQNRAQIMAFVIAVLGLIIAGVVAIFGQGYAAAIVGSVAAVVGVGGVTAATIAASRMSFTGKKPENPTRAR